MILDDLARETEGHLFPFRAIVDMLALPFVNPDMRRKVVEGAGRTLSDALALVKLGKIDDIELRKRAVVEAKDTQDMGQALIMLRQAGLADIMHRALED